MSARPDDPRDQHEIVRLAYQEGHQAGLPEWQSPQRPLRLTRPPLVLRRIDNHDGVGGAVLDPRQLPGRAELAPAQAVVAVEDERRVCRPRTHAGQLAVTVQLRRGVLADTLGMKSHAPAAAEDPVVALYQRGECRPRRLVERPDTVGGRSHEINVAPLTKISDPEVTPIPASCGMSARVIP